MKKNVSCKKLNNKTSIGGQAVLEGVMMRSSDSMAIAVRDADGIVRLETKRLNKGKKVKLHVTVPGSIKWQDRVFEGIIEQAGKDHVIVSNPNTGEWYLILIIYLERDFFAIPSNLGSYLAVIVCPSY